MKMMRWLLCGLMMMMLTAAPALAGEVVITKKGKEVKRARKPKKPKTLIRGHYAIMAKQLDLTDEQRAKLEELLKANKDAMGAWYKENGKEYKEISKALREARKAKNADAVKELSAKLKPLRKDRADLAKAFTGQINGILTPEQLAKWKDYQFYARNVGRYGRAKLTKEQKAEARDLCNAASKALAAAKGKDRRAITKKLQADIRALLTPEQIELLKRKPVKKPKGPKKVKVEKIEAH